MTTITTKVELDGPRNTRLLVNIQLTADLPYQQLVLPANLQGIDWTGAIKAGDLRIQSIFHDVQDLLSVQLFWDATIPVLITTLTGRNTLKAWEFGGLQDTAGAGGTGGLGIQTTGWNAGSTPQPMNVLLVLSLTKQQTFTG